MPKTQESIVQKTEIISLSNVSKRIYTLRGCQVMLDHDLAKIYGVELRALKQAVKRNTERFPGDFMWATTEQEFQIIRSQSVIEIAENSSDSALMPNIRSQIPEEMPLNERGRRTRKGSRYAPFAFTEHGVAMLSSILHSPKAIQINIEIIRVFTELRKAQGARLAVMPQIESLETMIKQRFDQLEARLQNQALAAPPRLAHHDSVIAIQDTVARHFGVNAADFKSASRIQPVSLARQIAIFFMRKYLGMGFSEIGRHLGGRDHSTILHAYRKIHVDSEDNEMVRKTVMTLSNLLQKQ